MKKFRSNLFSFKQDRKNQQVQADSKNRIAQIGRNMSQGAANVFKALRCHSNWGNFTQRASGTNRGHGKPGQNSNKKHGHY